jgi:hypothetical protein
MKLTLGECEYRGCNSQATILVAVSNPLSERTLITGACSAHSQECASHLVETLESKMIGLVPRSHIYLREVKKDEIIENVDGREDW